MLWQPAGVEETTGSQNKKPRIGDDVGAFSHNGLNANGMLHFHPVLPDARWAQMPAVNMSDLCAVPAFVPGSLTGYGHSVSSSSSPAASTCLPPLAQPQPGFGFAAASAGNDITQRIVDALQSRLPCNGGPASSTIPPFFANGLGGSSNLPGTAEPGLGSLLLNSLRDLAGDSVAACQSSDAGQELLRKVQSMAPMQSPGPSLCASPPNGMLPAVSSVEPSMPPLGNTAMSQTSAEAVLDSRPPPRALSPSPPRLSRPPRALAPPPVSPRRPIASPPTGEPDGESDDEVPHRLPPGFGAIPEDVIEERARQREEQRILQLKATQPCRFGQRCKKRDCPNAHPEGRSIDSAWNPCAFGRRCKRKGCFYDHPEGRDVDENPDKGMCKFGIRCSRPDCLYDHPDGRESAGSTDPRICFFCHDPGHIATDCPRNPESWNFARSQGGVVVTTPMKAIEN